MHETGRTSAHLPPPKRRVMRLIMR